MLDYWERRASILCGRSEDEKLDKPKTSEQIRLASIVEESIVDGPGLRFVIFAQGCPHRCPGCHNPQTHLSVGGTYFTLEEIISLYKKHPACRGITVSGGEPFEQGKPLAKVAEAVQLLQGDVVTYTGYYLEQLYKKAENDLGVSGLLNATDLLIDGPFVQEKRCLEAAFVGSSNQRLIALSARGNQLLNDIPVLPAAPKIKRKHLQG